MPTPAAEHRLRVELAERSYDIVIKPGLLAEVGPSAAALIKGRRCLIITDRNVGPKYGTLLASAMQRSGFDGSATELPPGEGTKTLKVAEFLYDRCLDAIQTRILLLLSHTGNQP